MRVRFVCLAKIPAPTENSPVHIPDGFLDLKTCLGSYCVAGAGLTLAMRKVRAAGSDKTVPLLGVMSAFLFAGQTVNFPIGGGISGHLLGSTLAAIVLGPSGAAIVVATVLFIQCLLFQDGGVTTFAANFLNLGLVGVGAGWLAFQFLGRWIQSPKSLVFASAIASWVSVLGASVACAFELAGSGTVSLRVILPPLMIAHAVIGVGEAAITAALISFLAKVRPDLILQPGRPVIQEATPSRLTPAHVICGLAFALGIGLLVAPFSSSLPDALEALATKLNFQDRAASFWPAPLADYTLPASAPEWLAVSIAVGCGTALAFVLVSTLARWLRRPRSESHAD